MLPQSLVDQSNSPLGRPIVLQTVTAYLEHLKWNQGIDVLGNPTSEGSKFVHLMLVREKGTNYMTVAILRSSL